MFSQQAETPISEMGDQTSRSWCIISPGALLAEKVGVAYEHATRR